tara:strand:- start:833 stop:1924 length:1092 start_codon:yes stop_codon:yes gene_type:complete
MKICLIGNSLSNLVLAKILLNKKIKVDLFYKNLNKVEKIARTIGISKDNIDYFNNNIFNLKKISWCIYKIKIFNEINKKKEFLNFKNYNTNPFSIVKYNQLIDKVNYVLKKEKNFRRYKIKSNSFYSEILNKNYNLIINSEKNNKISLNYFSNRIIKDYNSTAYATIVEHTRCSNRTASQIFTKIGPIAFLPISNTKTSVVFSVSNKINQYHEDEIKNYIRKNNFIYKIKSMSKVEKFKLEFSIPRNYYHSNILLFGDALHQIHPLAGQGFNMTLRDIKIFSKLIDKQLNLGLPIDSSILREFEYKLRHLNFLFAYGVDFIHEFFKFDNKLENFFSKKVFKYLNKNKFFNKYASKFANQGISF